MLSMDYNTKAAIMGAILGVISILGYFVSRSATRSEAVQFDLAQAFSDSSGKTSMGRITIFGAFIVATWGFVMLILADKMTEWYFTAYMTAFVVNAVGSKALEPKG